MEKNLTFFKIIEKLKTPCHTFKCNKKPNFFCFFRCFVLSNDTINLGNPGTVIKIK